MVLDRVRHGRIASHTHSPGDMGCASAAYESCCGGAPRPIAAKAVRAPAPFTVAPFAPGEGISMVGMGQWRANHSGCLTEKGRQRRPTVCHLLSPPRCFQAARATGGR